MITVTTEVTIQNWAKESMLNIIAGVVVGMNEGANKFVDTLKATIHNDSRIPTGELEGSVKIEDCDFDETMVMVSIVEGTDHAIAFEYGTSAHFVPYGKADDRIRNLMYDHIKPVNYEFDEEYTTSEKKTREVIPGGRKHKDKKPIGYNVYSDGRYSFRKTVDATEGYIVNSVSNGIREALEVN